MNTDVAIIGGGLAGLAVADALQRRGVDFRLIEARDRFGGRILSTTVTVGAQAVALDLGPAWFWPGQRRVADLADRLGLTTFRQHSTGTTVFEERGGGVRRDFPTALNPDALRIEGGLSRLIEGLVDGLSRDSLALNAAATGLTRRPTGWRVDMLREGVADSIDAKRVVLAVPPRVAAEHIRVTPALAPDQRAVLAETPTWMAGHAKAAVIYERPFWRDNGLSGDAISQRGPLVQVHDASPVDARLGALFGFIGIDARRRRELGDGDLRTLIARQLGALFGEDAARPTAMLVQDWSTEPFTATTVDLTPPAGHPQYRSSPALARLVDDGLIVAVTETAPHDGGLVEGALAAAEHATVMLEGSLRPATHKPASAAQI